MIRYLTFVLALLAAAPAYGQIPPYWPPVTPPYWSPVMPPPPSWNADIDKGPAATRTVIYNDRGGRPNSGRVGRHASAPGTVPPHRWPVKVVMLLLALALPPILFYRLRHHYSILRKWLAPNRIEEGGRHRDILGSNFAARDLKVKLTPCNSAAFVLNGLQRYRHRVGLFLTATVVPALRASIAISIAADLENAHTWN
jgi:hypothetical protein